ncbi:MAG: class I SAM-dependent methyltransferase [Lachnospiraceae bacterium]|nr:class I SAM-dependent methyltransferase [Lachnospiraceae bacterium]
MRIQGKVEKIDYSECEKFFQNRGKKYKEKNPYSVTMYQDECPELVEKRNKAEVSRLLPLLKLDEDSRVLDVACGIGRWADAINKKIDRYVGVDFSKNIIDLAINRNTHENYNFYVSEVTEIRNLLDSINEKNFNVVLMIGILVYLNDEDIFSVTDQVEKCLDRRCRICIREPIGIEHRLTLKDFYSEELNDNYNAIYRTRDELKEHFNKALFDRGFEIKKEGFLFDDKKLNNRKETAQYYFLLERE